MSADPIHKFILDQQIAPTIRGPLSAAECITILEQKVSLLRKPLAFYSEKSYKDICRLLRGKHKFYIFRNCNDVIKFWWDTEWNMARRIVYMIWTCLHGSNDFDDYWNQAVLQKWNQSQKVPTVHVPGFITPAKKKKTNNRSYSDSMSIIIFILIFILITIQYVANIFIVYLHNIYIIIIYRIRIYKKKKNYLKYMYAVIAVLI